VGLIESARGALRCGQRRATSRRPSSQNTGVLLRVSPVRASSATPTSESHWPLAIGHWPLAIGQVKAAPSVGAKHRINYPLVFLRAHGRNFSVIPPIGSGKHYNFAISERARAPLARAHKLHTNGQGRRQERMCRAGRWQGSSAQAHSGPKPLSLSPEPPPGPW